MYKTFSQLKKPEPQAHEICPKCGEIFIDSKCGECKNEMSQCDCTHNTFTCINKHTWVLNQ